MQLSYSLIKKEQALSGNSRKIITNYGVDTSAKVKEDSIKNDYSEEICSYERMGENIILQAQRKRDEILIEAMRESQITEKEAYERGYEQGKSNGYDDGKTEALNKYIPQAKETSNNLIKEAEAVLLSAEIDYKNYLDDKRKEILELSISIAEKILNIEVTKDDGITQIVEEAIEGSKGEENIIIKCNPIHENDIQDKIGFWKTNYSIKGEIFILVDKNISSGNAIIQKNSGKIEVGIESGLEQIRYAILGQ